VRAVAVDQQSAPLVAINVRATCRRLAFAFGGALVAAGGVLVSMFLTFNANIGVVFTMKALIVVIMGGVGNLLGCLVAGLILGPRRNLRRDFVDPGLTLATTYALFLIILLMPPAGPVRNGGAMKPASCLAAGAIAVAILATVPLYATATSYRSRSPC
jgi:branched-chain amino acid transport system permease protein